MSIRERIRRPVRLACLLLAVAVDAGVSAGCGDDSAGPSVTDLTGSWSATMIRYESRVSTDTIDLVAEGGSGRLVLAADGTFQLTITPPGGAPATTVGTWSLGGDVMTMTATGFSFSWQFDCTVSADELQLVGASAEWDFDDDLTPEDATWSMTFVRE